MPVKFVNVLESRLFLTYCIVSECLYRNFSRISHAQIFKSKRCFIVKYFTYYFHKTKILADSQICISVTLMSTYWEHGTIIRTGIKCKKIPCYMRDSACRWFIVKTAKIFWRTQNPDSRKWGSLTMLSLNSGSAQVQILIVRCRRFAIVKWSRLETRLNAFRRSTIPQKYFIIIIISSSASSSCSTANGESLYIYPSLTSWNNPGRTKHHCLNHLQTLHKH